jgi:TonB family protein
VTRVTGGGVRAFPERGAPTAVAPELEGLSDPMVFAAAHPEGFSSSAWLTPPRVGYALSNSIPPPRFLAFERTPSAFEDVNSRPAPTAPLPMLDFPIAKTPAKSIFSIEGDLAARPLMAPVELSVQFGSDVLSNSIVRVGVQADGFPVSTRLISGSGSRAVDLNALEIARKMKFAPLPVNVSRDGQKLQWGELVFQWFTTEPPSTNPPPALNAAANLPKS